MITNYPNPFNPVTEIRFRVDETGIVILNVYNAIGQRVAQLVNGEMGIGDHTDTFNGSDLSSGIYFMQLQTGDRVQIQENGPAKMMTCKRLRLFHSCYEW